MRLSTSDWSALFQTLVSWPGWDWHGWNPIGSLALAGALIFVAAQTRLATQQARREEAERFDKEWKRRRRGEQSRRPYITLVGDGWRVDGDEVAGLDCQVNADGDGVAHGLYLRLFLVRDGARESVGRALFLEYIRTPSTSSVTFDYPGALPTTPQPALVTAVYADMFGYWVGFDVEARITPDEGLELTEAPRYRWPPLALRHPKHLQFPQ